MSRTSFDAYEEGKDCSTWDEKIDWSRSGNFTFASPVSSSDSEPPPPPTDESDSSSSTFAEHVPSSSSSSIDTDDDIDDGATNRQFECVEVIGGLTLLEGRHEDYKVEDAAAKCDEDGILGCDGTRSSDFDRSCASSNDGQLEDVDVIGALALLEEYEEGFNNDYDDSVEVETSDNSALALECFNVILGRFALRCALDHWKCMTTKEAEKCKQMQRQQACLQLRQTLLRVKVRHSLLLWSHSINRIAWQESVVGLIRQRHLGNAFRCWRDVTKASKMRRQLYFLMMIFNRWRVLTEESVATRQKKYAALMHWAERLTRKSFSALKLHAASQREEREHGRGSYQPRQLFRSSLRSPEQSFAWRNDTPDCTKRLSFSKSTHKSWFNDQESRYRGSGFASSSESFAEVNSLRAPFQSISPSTRFSKTRFHELGSSQKVSHSSSYHSTGRRSISSEMLHNSRRMSLSQPNSSHSSQDKFAIPFGCEADDIV